MNISKRNLGLMLIVVAAVIGAHLATVAVGQPSARTAEPARPDNMLVRWLGLSGEKATIVTEAHKSFRRDMRQRQRRIEIETLELASLIEADETTEDQLRAQFGKLSKAHVAVHNRVAELVLAVRPHLDSDQRARFNEMISRYLRGKGGRGRGGRGQGRPDRMHRRPDGEGRRFQKGPGDRRMRQPQHDGMRRRPMHGPDGRQGQPDRLPPPPERQSDAAQ